MISIIIPCRNEGDNLRNTLNSMMAVRTGLPFEVIVVDDGSADNCCNFLGQQTDPTDWPAPVKLLTMRNLGAARARNYGAAQAQGEILVFCDAHISVVDNWLDELAGALHHSAVAAVTPGIASMDNPSLVGYGQTWDSELGTRWLPRPRNLYPVPLGPSGCLAVKRSVFDLVGGFESFFRVWGLEDLEFSLKLWLFGQRVYTHPGFQVLHLFRTAHPYTVTMEHYHYNLLLMAYYHFNRRRLEKIIDLIKNWGYFAGNLADILTNRLINTRRQDYLARRVHDDEWFCNRFGIEL